MKPARLFSRLLFPSRCVACEELEEPLADERYTVLCPACNALYERALRTGCSDCGLPIYDCMCVPPLLRKAGISAHVKAAPYGTDARLRVPSRVVLCMKEHNRGDLFAFAARELSSGVQNALARSDGSFLANGEAVPETVVTFVPRNRHVVRRVGFDQSAYLSKALAREAGLTFRRLLVRDRRTKEQKKQTAKARQENLKNAFRACGGAGLRVLLVDDVVTTGASMAAAARELYRAGAREVIAVSFSYTLKHGKII